VSDRLSGAIFGFKRIAKYLTDSELRKAYAEYKESEDTALRLIINTILSEGWLVTLSRPRSVEDLATEHGYSNVSILQKILALLVNHDVLIKDDKGYSIKSIQTTPIRPDDIGTVLTNFYYDCSLFLPEALRGNTLNIDDVPRVVLEAVFSSRLTEIGRGVLLRSFSSGDVEEVGVAAFADVGLPYAINQINEILNPKVIHVFLNDYRWQSSITSFLKFISKKDVLNKVQTHLFGISTLELLQIQLDLFYGEEFFAWSHERLNQRSELVSSYLKSGGRLITNDPIIEESEISISPAYCLMQTIEGYPQPIPKEMLTNIFENKSLRIQVIGNNWVAAEKVGN
jgi:hypothetical protein